MSIEEDEEVKKIKLRYGVLDPSKTSLLVNYIAEILGYNPYNLFKPPLHYTCFSSNRCIIHEETGKYGRATLLYSGKWIGVLVKGKPYPSPQIYEEVYRRRGEYRAAVIVKEKGVKAFLYGNDILEESIIEEYEPLNNAVAVIDQTDHRVIGVAKKILNRRKYYQNIYDLGLFLREWGG